MAYGVIGIETRLKHFVIPLEVRVGSHSAIGKSIPSSDPFSCPALVPIEDITNILYYGIKTGIVYEF